MKILDLWFGSEASVMEYNLAVQGLAALQAQGEEAVKLRISQMWHGKGEKSSDPFALPPIWQNEDGVAVLAVQGPLISGHAGFLRLFGLTGYGDIQQAVGEIAASKDAKSVMLMIDSGGGDVNGVEETGNAIRQLAGLKPVWAHSDGGMMSAAYWLGASADKTLATKTSQVGSVGTIMISTEYTKQLEMEGIKKTVIRSGEFKALGNPFEVLSEEAKAEKQAMADEASDIFVEYVSERRGVSPAQFQKKMGEGRVFMGRPAQAVGLIDGVMSFGDALSALKKLDNSKSQPQNSRNQRDSTMKATLASALMLQLIAGAAVESLDLKVAGATVEGVEPDADAQAALKAQALEVVAGVKAAADTAAAAAVTAAVEPLNATIAQMTADAATVKGEVTLLKAAAQTLTADRDVALELSDQMSVVLKNSISTMSVALQGAKDAGKDLTGQALLDEHARLAAQFTAKFPHSGVAAIAIEATEKTQTQPTQFDDPVFLHAVHSLRPASRK